jgi:undecaprenyl-diphosphatase
MEWLEALILGVVQGLTEFLPVSSDGHLALCQIGFAHLKGQGHTAKEDVFVDVMLHFGTLIAILIYYRAVLRTATRGLLGSAEVPPTYRRGALVRTGALVFVALLPLIPDKLFFMDMIEQAFHSVRAVGTGFLISAAALILTFWFGGGEKGPRETTWLDALLIGISQALAPLPGVSRSGLTVAAALLLGLNRAWAVGFSFLIGVPAILGATVLKVRDVERSSLSGDRVAPLVTAMVLAGLVGYLAIIWLVKIVRSGRLWYFSVYLIVLGLVVWAMAPVLGDWPDAPRSQAVDRSAWVGTPGAGAGHRAGRGAVAGDRAHGLGAGAGGMGLGRAAGGGPRPSRLVVG